MKRCYGSPDLEWLHPENFGDEPVYCEASPPENPDDILCHGSDDEAYSSPTERRIRYEVQAQRFLVGKPMFLLSASLRGPFDRKSGWVNPWRSRSAGRVDRKSAQKKRRIESREGAKQHESSGILESSSPRQQTPEIWVPPPPKTCIPSHYMDGETYRRVRKWRDDVVAESDTVRCSFEEISQPEPASAVSRRATQYTDGRRSGLSLETVDVGLKSSASYTPSAVNGVDEHNSSRVSGPSVGQVLGAQADPDPATLSLDCPSSGPLPLPDAADLSPRAVRLYEQIVLSKRKDGVPAENQAAEETTNGDRMPMDVSTLAKPPAVNGSSDETNGTPSGVPRAAAATTALLRTQASARTDGSFRYKRKDGRGKASSPRRSKLASPPFASSDAAARPSASRSVSPNRALENGEAPEPGEAGDIPEAATEVVLEVAQGTTVEDVPEPEIPQDIQQPAEQAADESQNENHSAAETASQIDGPTLVPSESPSSSEHPSMPSFGHFSVEKHSQEVIPEAIGLPRRLLWPKSRNRNSQSSFGLGSTRTPLRKQPAPGSEHARSSSPADSRSADEVTPQLADENQAAQEAPEEASTSNQGKQSADEDGSEDDRVPAVEDAAGSETASEAEDKNVHETEQPSSGSVTGDNAAPVEQLTSPRPVPEAQSPWVKDRTTPTSESAAHSPQHNGEVEMAKAKLSSPKATQSPWVKEANPVPGISGIPPQLPIPNPACAKLSSMASQALEQSASQSPWARGDSQMQLPLPVPEVRLFNPLSSPANSHVLPTADPVPQPQASHDEDIDMCDSQLYPPPSTPETKQSGLPSPDFTLSVKSFKNFMTPSPQPATKRRRISTDHLPSTQALVDAAISNPWTRPPNTQPKKHKQRQKQQQQQRHESRPQKRVSWAPLPDEDDEENMPTSPSAELPSTTPLPQSRKTNHPTHRRATSPPPSILSTSKLPSANQKFGKHFAAVAGRRVGMTPLSQNQRNQRGVGGGNCVSSGPGVRLLPSASQQVCASPAVGAMAEAFLKADRGRHAVTSADSAMELGAGEGVIVDGEREETSDVMDGSAVRYEEVMDVDPRGEGMGFEEEEGTETQEMQDVAEEELPVDEVSAVMENLDDFLGGTWDLDADLAKVRAEQAKEARSYDDLSGGGGLSGLMDVGVWD